ncbi:MAG: hypothetical protein IJU19_01860 [Bacteroidales bacterium]|nr:hypothetical protein [Bacteroidales bacterium]
MKRWLLIILVSVCPMAWGQVDYEVEQWLQDEGSETAASEWHDRIEELRDAPVNINDTVEVERLPFLTPFHRQALKNYIRLYGDLLSSNELALVPGFDSTLLAMILPLIKVEPMPRSERWRWWTGRHTLTMGLGGTVEKAAGYTNGNYEGDNLHALSCYTYNYRGRLKMVLAADKDPAEAWGKDNFVGYSLMVSDLGRIEKAIIGRYNIQWGQGLTLWTGAAPFDITGRTSMRAGAGLKEAGTFNEYNYLEGAAATVRLWKGWRATGFGSLRDGEKMAGGHVEWRMGTFVVGATLQTLSLQDSVNPRSYVYNKLAFRGDRQQHVGIDGMWQLGKVLLYGEASSDEDGDLAAVVGMTVGVSNNHHIGISIRNYSPQYHNLHSQAYSMSAAENEQGMRVDIQSQFPWEIKGALTADVHSFPSLRYASYRPSEGIKLKAQLEKRFVDYYVATIRYSYRQKSRNIPYLDSNLYIGEYTDWHQLQAEVKGSWERWTLAGRMVSVMFGSENTGLQRGRMAALTAQYKYNRWQVAAALAYFKTDGYYTRIYMSESSIQYVWNIPMLYGEGIRSYLLVRYTVNQRLSAVVKYGLTAYRGVDHVGSGDAQTEGPLRQTWHTQVRWHF